MRRFGLHIAILSAFAAFSGCAGKSSVGHVPVDTQNGVADPSAVRVPSERLGTRGAVRGPDQSLPSPENSAGGGNTPTEPTPAPNPSPEPNNEPTPTPTPTGQLLNASIYCSDDLVKWSEASMASVSKLKFHFFEKGRSNFLAYSVWDKGTDTASLKDSLKQKKALLPEFAGLADGIYDVLICNQADPDCNFIKSFSPFSLHNTIMHGEAYGVVGVVHLHITAGKVTSYDNGWFLYPTGTSQVTCDKT